ncbi:GNAT family N-acetyltransferase [Flavobacterium sp.]|uniref:GNAT family N-acetyltransferase n=1 Tax=Flavobacterium sp. TaxID=239 RepID=UPI0026093E6A|nr:GNAT family N-acetyltransferase [Flavobacterium sp.]
MSFLTNNNLQFKIVTAPELYTVRQPVLRPHLQPEDCGFEGDTDPDSMHFAAFIDDRMVGVLTALHRTHVHFGDKAAIQFRGMAVLADFQGRKIGGALLQWAETVLVQQGAHRFWLNARIKAVPFYETANYRGNGTYFDIPGIGPHQTLFKTLDKPL